MAAAYGTNVEFELLAGDKELAIAEVHVRCAAGVARIGEGRPVVRLAGVSRSHRTRFEPPKPLSFKVSRKTVNVAPSSFSRGEPALQG